MDLEAWRKSQGLVYRDVAELIGASSPGKARQYALGGSWPREDQLARILDRCSGIDLFAMHQRRLEWVRQNQREIKGLDGSDVRHTLKPCSASEPPGTLP